MQNWPQCFPSILKQYDFKALPCGGMGEDVRDKRVTFLTLTGHSSAFGWRGDTARITCILVGKRWGLRLPVNLQLRKATVGIKKALAFQIVKFYRIICFTSQSCVAL